MIIVIVGLVFFISSCSPVRSGNKNRSIDSEKETPAALDTIGSDEDDGWEIDESSLGSGTNSQMPEEKDTLIIRLDPIVYKYADTNQSTAIDQQITDISEMLDNGMTEQACSLSEALWDSLEEGEQKWHARFFMGECLIAKNDLEGAKDIFASLLEGPARKDAREKSLIRMGQIYCLEGDTIKANEYFIQLRTDYPKSIYIPLAVCNN